MPYTLSQKKTNTSPRIYPTPNIAPSLKARALETSKIHNSSPLFTIPMHIVYNYRIHIPTSCKKENNQLKVLNISQFHTYIHITKCGKFE
jgi:hypothetical protein